MAEDKNNNLISIELQDGDTTTPFALPTEEDAREWIEAYKEQWQWVQPFARQNHPALKTIASSIWSFITTTEQRLNQLTQPNQNTDQIKKQLEAHFKSNWRKGWIPEHDQHTEFALEQRAKGDDYALMVLHYFQNGAIQPNQLKGQLLEAVFSAFIYKRQLAELTPSTKATLTKSVSSFEGELSKLREQRQDHDESWKSQLKEIQKSLKEHSDNLQNLHDTRQEKLDQFIDESDKKIEAWKKAHREEINLKEPVTFWSAKQRSSLIAWIVLGIVFIAGLVVSGRILVDQSHSIYEGLKVGDKIEYWRVAAMLLLGGLAFWFLRILSKIFLSQLHAWSDAQERVTMVQTYLSLLQDGKGLGTEDRRLILEALFRPAPSGIIKDDGVPPAMFDMISRLK